jgi:hypothetical protein
MKGDKVNEMTKAKSKAEVSESHRFNIFYSGPKYVIFNKEENK